jgi:hypothetical protein
VGIDRVTAVNPLTNGSRTCPWTDPNGDGMFQDSEINVAQCSAFSGGVGFRYAEGLAWPYSDEATVGFETQLPGEVRFGTMYYYRTNREQFANRNMAVPTSAYTPFTLTIPNGPGGSLSNPVPATVTGYNLNPAFLGLNDTVRDNDSFLDTNYHGIEFTGTKRFSRSWQMQAGLTLGRNRGGVTNGTVDLNDPNVTMNPEGIVGNDSTVAFRLSGSYLLPYDINLAGSLISNNGYPYQTNYSISRAFAATQGVTLARATQTVTLSERGDERFDTVTMMDIRLSRQFRFGTRSFTPQVDFFNITNADTTTALNTQVGSSYLFPSEILSPRIIRVGFSLNF